MQKKAIRQQKIADYLRTQKGLIRILLPTQFGDGFDMRIPCLNNDWYNERYFLY